VARRASSPGRVTILGEHTDYNGGVALGVATAERTTVDLVRRADGRVEVRSAALGVASGPLAATSGTAFLRLATALVRAACMDGATLLVGGDLPIGAGMSSSAAYAVATALALGIKGSALEIATTCRAAEAVSGSDVGLLDQLVVLHATRGTVVDLDFESGAVSTFALSDAVALSVVDTGERREVAGSAYAQRRAECARASAAVGTLGQATAADVARITEPVARRRARHVVTECARVVQGREALRTGDLAALGALLDEGHTSLRNDFEVTTPRVEAVRDEVLLTPGVAGARLVGAGFGGCLVVAHDPAVDLRDRGLPSRRLLPGPGASVSRR